MGKGSEAGIGDLCTYLPIADQILHRKNALVATYLQKETHMSFPLYLIGFLIVIGGVAWGLVVAGVPSLYIVIACVILVGVAILSGVSKTRQKDPPTT